MRSANSVEILCHLVYIILSCFTGAVRRPLRATGYLFGPWMHRVITRLHWSASNPGPNSRWSTVPTLHSSQHS